MMTSVIFKSLSSSRWARTPVRKKILLCPILYKLGSSSRALICRRKEDKSARFQPCQGARLGCLRRAPPEAAPGRATRGWEVCSWPSGAGLTMRMQACFPSMKPLGMAFAARIS